MIWFFAYSSCNNIKLKAKITFSLILTKQNLSLTTSKTYNSSTTATVVPHYRWPMGQVVGTAARLGFGLASA